MKESISVHLDKISLHSQNTLLCPTTWSNASSALWRIAIQINEIIIVQEKIRSYFAQ